MPPQPMNDHEKDAFAELIAIKVAEKYLLIMEKHVSTQIKLHKAECSVGKFTKVISVISAIFCGVCVALFSWFLKKD